MMIDFIWHILYNRYMEESIIENVVKDLALQLKSQKAQNITVLNMKAQTPNHQFLIISSVEDEDMAKSVYESTNAWCGQHNIEVKYADGINKGEWIVLDLEQIIIHIFRKDLREKYNLEKLFKDAEKLKI